MTMGCKASGFVMSRREVIPKSFRHLLRIMKVLHFRRTGTTSIFARLRTQATLISIFTALPYWGGHRKELCKTLTVLSLHFLLTASASRTFGTTTRNPASTASLLHPWQATKREF